MVKINMNISLFSYYYLHSYYSLASTLSTLLTEIIEYQILARIIYSLIFLLISISQLHLLICQNLSEHPP